MYSIVSLSEVEYLRNKLSFSISPMAEPEVDVGIRNFTCFFFSASEHLRNKLVRVISFYLDQFACSPQFFKA